MEKCAAFGCCRTRERKDGWRGGGGAAESFTQTRWVSAPSERLLRRPGTKALRRCVAEVAPVGEGLGKGLKVGGGKGGEDTAGDVL